MKKFNFKKILSATLVAGSLATIVGVQTTQAAYDYNYVFNAMGGADTTYYAKKYSASSVQQNINSWTNRGENFNAWVTARNSSNAMSKTVNFDDSDIGKAYYFSNQVYETYGITDCRINARMSSNWASSTVYGTWKPDR
ncbi:hypothetical protein [Bacillus sp. 3G2]|uniref:hypothetical protein n=1 Tax=Bacillus sp. 3G2 TaxID=3375707 RepID=UPI003787010C